MFVKTQVILCSDPTISHATEQISISLLQITISHRLVDHFDN